MSNALDSLRRKLTSRDRKGQALVSGKSAEARGLSDNSNPFAVRPPSNPDAPPPPAYSPAPYAGHHTTSTDHGGSNPFNFLRSFDTVFLMDDSGSMAGSRGHETRDASKSITPICTTYNAKGDNVDVLHSNTTSPNYVTSAGLVEQVFNRVRPGRVTPTGQRLHAILKPYLEEDKKDSKDAEPKPMNLICITDGVPTDDVERPLIQAARRLDKMNAPPWQVGIEFCQVGRDKAAREHLSSVVRPTEPIVECRINGTLARAFPDSGAGANYISEDEVKREKYPVDSSEAGQVKLAGGSWTNTLGTVDLTFSFLNESQTYSLKFHVVRRCIQDVIIGSPFLRLTETLTKYWARITRVLRKEGACRVRLLGAPRQRALGFLDGNAVSALPDTGADLSLVSANFASKHYWAIDRSAEHRIDIEFADGSIGRTSGVVKDLPWEFGFGLGKDYRADFYVYDKLECLVILGYDFLCDSEAFTNHAESLQWLEDIDDDDLTGHLSAIKICMNRADGGRSLKDLFKRKKVTTNTLLAAAINLPVLLPNTKISFHADDVHAYRRAERDMLRRREELEHKLAALPQGDRAGVQAELDGWTEDWDLLNALKPGPQGGNGPRGRSKQICSSTLARSASASGSRGALITSNSNVSSSAP